MYVMLVTHGDCIEDGIYETQGFKITNGKNVEQEYFDAYNEYSCESEDYQDWVVTLLKSENPFSVVKTVCKSGETTSEKIDAEYTNNLEEWL